MNIGIVTTWFPAGAGYVSKAYRQTLAYQHNVYIYGRQGKSMKGDQVWDDDKVYWAKKHYNGIDLKDFKKWIERNKIELILFNEQRYWRPVILAKKIGVCIGAYIDYYKEDTVKAFSIYDFLICNTKRHFSVFNWHQKCYYIPWGTDINVFKKQDSKRNGKLRFLISLGWEGNYPGDRKGLMLALNAFTQVKGDCELLVYSQVELSDCVSQWGNLIESDSRIKFIFGTYDPFPYHEGDVYVYPSRLDGIGLSLPEALSCGVPAITTDNPPMNEFVINNINGQLVEVEKLISRSDGYYWPQSICSIDSIRKALQKYVAEPDLVKVHGIAARDFAEKKMNWKVNSANITAIFEENLRSGKSHELNSEDEEHAFKLDRKYYPSLKYRSLALLRDVLNEFGIDAKSIAMALRWRIE